MKQSRARRVACVVSALIVLSVLGWRDWRGERPEAFELLQLVRAQGALQVGAGKAALMPISGVDKAGYPPRRPRADGQATPLFARALALRVGDAATLGLVSLDLLEVSEELADEIDRGARSLGLSAVLVTATHTHSSLGGYDRNLAVRAAALGHFDAAQQREIMTRSIEALAQACARVEPARARWSTRPLQGLNRNRAQADGPIDRDLRVLAFDAEASGAAIATLFSFDAHPTLVARHSAQLDADFPGRTSELIEVSTGAPALFFQGAAGDAGALPPKEDAQLPKTALMAARLSEEVSHALALATPLPIDALAIARGRLALPKAQAPATVPRFLQRPAANLLQAVLMERAPLALIRLGPLTLVAIPGEPTFFTGQNLRQALGGEHVIFAGLAHGYVGYVESAVRREQGLGESRRALWAPELEARLIDGVEQLLTALDAPDTPLSNTPSAGADPT
ncbi:MAG: neutral/alkaline non-lysosomal ceramidase N-terminal domain-containing protein [Myxococcales bacterium]|nr:neutral/alkaline non-lysosomal ceramidase N-terminal domain-containing protein [Myxococcales bacterium]